MFCGIGGMTDPEAVGIVRQRHHRRRPRPGVRPGVPDRGHRPQDRRLPADLRARPRPRRDPPGRRPLPARTGPRRDRAPPRVPDGRAAHRGPRPPGDRPDHPSRRSAPTPDRLRGEPSDRHDPRPNRSTPRSSPEAAFTSGWALVLISVAQLMVVLDGTIVNIALPYIQHDLDIASANLTWVVTGYALAFGSLLLLGGRLGDLYGRRKIFMIGLVIFAVASGLGGLATNEGTLLAARGLQGLGAALASPAALALITTTFPAGPARNRAFAMYAAMSGVGAAVGLLLGGWLTGLSPHHRRLDDRRLAPDPADQHADRPRRGRASRRASCASPSRTDHKLDLPGAVTGTLGLLGLVYGLSRAGTDGWTDHWTIASLVAGVDPARRVRARREPRRAPAAAVPGLHAPHPRGAASWRCSSPRPRCSRCSSSSASTSRTSWATARSRPASRSCRSASASWSPPGISSNLVNRIDPRYLAGVGTLMAAAALFGFSRLPYDTTFPVEAVTGSYVTDLLPFILLMSLGMGMTFVPLTLTAVHHLRAEDSGIGSGVLNTMQQVGGALGPGDPRHRGDADLHRPGAELSGRREGRAAGGPQPSEPSSRRPRWSPAAGLHRGRDRRVPGGRGPDADRLGRDLDLPQRQARGAGHRRPPRVRTSGSDAVRTTSETAAPRVSGSSRSMAPCSGQRAR